MKRRLIGIKFIIIAVAVIVVLTCTIFSVPFYSVPYYTLETYYVTEIKQEPYLSTESYISRELTEKEEILFNDMAASVPYGIRFPFTITKANSKLIGNFTLPAPGGFYLYGRAGQIIYEQLGVSGSIELPLTEGVYEAQLLERVRWEGMLYLYLKVTWTEIEEIMKYREITNYKEVPVSIEKQRTVTNYKKVSLWKALFSK